MSISLRQKRTGGKLKIGNPVLISAPQSATLNTIDIGSKEISSISSRNTSTTTLATLPGNNPRPRTRDDNRTADLVKRRYSTRFANLGEAESGDAVPGVPSLPAVFQIRPPPSRDGGSSLAPSFRTTPLKVDAAMLKDPQFNADDYVARALQDASEQDIENFQRDLRQLKTRADSDIQHNVFANREQFIKISREADKLKGELRTIRNLMSELTGTLGQVTLASGVNGSSGPNSLDSFPSGMSRNRSNRSSVANLEALWSSHLQELWKRVEGSQKYLPAIPGRHVVYESGRWVELNSATWKPRRKVHLILLNDHLLIAAEKKKPQDAQNSRDAKDKQGSAPLIALKCWPLQDVQIADLNMRVKPGIADPDASGNSINIRVGPESMTFATASKEIREKLSLLSNFRKSSEDLRRKLETESQEQDRSQDIVNGLGSPFLKTSFGESTSSGLGTKIDILVDVDGKTQSLRKVENEIDDLDIKIALQYFDEAVEKVEVLRRTVKGMRGNATAHKILSTKLDARASKLASVLVKYLGETHSWLKSTQKHVDWLVKLGYEDQAREAYLESRTRVIQKRIRQVIFEGDLHVYIYQISYIYFMMIKHSALIFQSCFPISMISACVKWAKGHVDDFNALLERQLSSVEENSQTYKDCMNRARKHASMLNEVGFDFKDFIGEKKSAG